MLISEESLPKFGFDLMGSMPKNDSDQLEVALTKKACLMMGWVSEGEMENRSAFEDIIRNRKYKIDFSSINGDTVMHEAAITGIVDTHYKFDFKEEEMSEYSFKIMKEGAKNFELHDGIFLSEKMFYWATTSGSEPMTIDGSCFDRTTIAGEFIIPARAKNGIHVYTFNDMANVTSFRFENDVSDGASYTENGVLYSRNFNGHPYDALHFYPRGATAETFNIPSNVRNFCPHTGIQNEYLKNHKFRHERNNKPILILHYMP